MQSTIDDFNKVNSVPQIYRDRLGRYIFEPVRTGVIDCCGFAYQIVGKDKDSEDEKDTDIV